uniref:NADH-ubiquinone oxidoreductase chain 3 n=1 Tax=Pharyngomonas kirbyi TaxID=63601 RepID=A0A1W6R293_9EUKA|nr:NADH dehydrogenase subunit 3 [Pharyngomonas kirbyi]ARO48013.1 NADH dehydrogenase subunit 3 [Pharyngomonas kirbyi]
MPFFLLSAGISTLLVAISYLVANQNMDVEKTSGYECGFDPFNDARDPFYIQFYIVALLFIIFDIEVIFFVPFVASIKYLTVIGYYFMFIFIVLLITSLFHEWNKKCIEL